MISPKARRGWPRSQSLRDADRRQDRGNSVLGAARRRRAVPGFCHQLRAPGLPRTLVSTIRLVHVPLPRRSVLSRRFARFGPAGTRAVRVSVQGAGRYGYDSSWRIADSGIPNRLSFRGQAAVRYTERVDFHREQAVRLQRNECFARKDKDMGVIGQIGQWFDQRLQLAAPIRDAAEHPVPRNTASWFYVFGSAALTVFLVQVVTGILLALIYVPSAGDAWSSLQALNHNVTLGWFIRAMHGWGSNFMVAIVLIHMTQVFLFGAHKYPRELTWIVGVFLLLMTLGMAFTGQIMRFDQDAYWGLGIGASIASRVPIIGPAVVKLMLGGPIIAGATLSRFFALHVFVIPGMLIAFVSLHVLMVLKLGINEWPMPGRIVKRATYDAQYHALTRKQGAPFVPYAVWKDMFFAAFIILAIAACAYYFGPFGPTGQPDPTIIQTAPKPDYFFLWLYALLSLLPPSLETPFLLIGPPLVVLGLILLPFLSGEGEKSWKRRPIAVITVLMIAITLGTFTHLAQFIPWIPSMNAWSGDPVPDRYIHGTTALERQGALVFQVKQCRNCHSIGNTGGQRGPTLDSVAVRLTQDQLIRQVIQGGGNMPAYGNNLSPAETTALVPFLETLHPATPSPARDAARDLVLSESSSQSAPQP